MHTIDIQCERCGGRHTLDSSLAREAARELIARFDQNSHAGDGEGHTEPVENSATLFAPGGGKMFGYLVAESPSGAQCALTAYSGMLDGRWELPGWAPPAFDVPAWRGLEARYDPEIAKVTARIDRGGADVPDLRRQRAQMSRELMMRYHDLYRLYGASGACQSLETVVGQGNMASGMGDCCAPKLLTEAHRRGLRAISLAEFFVGVSRRPGQRVHGEFYAPCSEKCGPLMSFLLCPN